MRGHNRQQSGCASQTVPSMLHAATALDDAAMALWSRVRGVDWIVLTIVTQLAL